MMVGIHQPGQDHVAGSIDNLGAPGGFYIPADRGDPVALDEDIETGQVRPGDPANRRRSAFGLGPFARPGPSPSRSF